MLSEKDISFEEYTDTPDGKRILFIVNPFAGKGIRKKKLQKIINIFKNDGWHVTLYLTVSRGDATQRVKMTDGKFDRIVCLGGDGTLNEVIRGVMQLENPVPVGYIPAGSTNDLGSSIGLPKNNYKAAKIVSKGRIREHDIGMFNGESFVYIASFGAFTEVSWDTPQKIKKIMGHLAYVFRGAKSLFKIKSTHTVVTTDTRTFEGNYIFCGAANTMQTGGIYKFNESEVNLSDGLLEVILVKNPESAADVPNLIHRLISHRFDQMEVTFIHTRKAVFSYPEKDYPIWTLDGEKGESDGDVTIECVHGKVNLIY